MSEWLTLLSTSNVCQSMLLWHYLLLQEIAYVIQNASGFQYYQKQADPHVWISDSTFNKLISSLYVRARSCSTTYCNKEQLTPYEMHLTFDIIKSKKISCLSNWLYFLQVYKLLLCQTVFLSDTTYCYKLLLLQTIINPAHVREGRFWYY